MLFPRLRAAQTTSGTCRPSALPAIERKRTERQPEAAGGVLKVKSEYQPVPVGAVNFTHQQNRGFNINGFRYGQT